MRGVIIQLVFLCLCGFQSRSILPEIYTYVKGYRYTKAVILDIETLKKGISLAVTDTTYKVVYFKVSCQPKNEDWIKKDFSGSNFLLDSLPSFRKIRKGDIIKIDPVKAKGENLSLQVQGLDIYIKE